MANYTNDDYMIYSLKNHRYTLTTDSIENELGISLDDILSDTDGNASTRWLNRLSRVFYSYLYSYSQSKEMSEYFLSLPLNRDNIYEGLLMLAEAWLINRHDPGMLFGTDGTYITPELIDFVRASGLASRNLFLFAKDYNKNKGIDY